MCNDSIMNSIIEFAKKEDNIIAVMLCGSRNNTLVKKDIYQDYDLIFVVKEIALYLNHDLNHDPRITIYQCPDEMDEKLHHSADLLNHFAYLIQFKTGIRLDIQLFSESYAKHTIPKDSLCSIILDKTNMFSTLIPSVDSYIIHKPTYDEFESCCNEFWWISLYVLKGILREDIFYALDNFNHHLRPELKKMIEWTVSSKHDYAITLGKSLQYLSTYQNDYYIEYKSTFPSNSVESIYESLLIAISLFEKCSSKLSDSETYPLQEYRNHCRKCIEQKTFCITKKYSI